ncbi:MAG: methyl-accepting chemotaxis protein [Paraglaciecola sp.]|jgi:methyl-accepting chemotaxis protein
MAGSVIEMIRPIIKDEDEDEDDVLGYVYLRASLQALENRIVQSIMTTVCVLLICLLICFFLTLTLQRAITAPINSLVKLVQRISRQKDYSNRTEPNRTG